MSFFVYLAVAVALKPPGDLGQENASSVARDRDTAGALWRLLPPVTGDMPVARFTRPICAAVIGLAPAKAEAIRHRIAAVTATASIDFTRSACTSNFLIAVVPDGRAFVRDLMKQRSGALRSQSIANIRRILREPHGARAWIETQVLSRDGDPITSGSLIDVAEAPGGPPMLTTQASSRLTLSYRRDIVSAVVVLDRRTAAAANAVTIADYAVMRGLLGANPPQRQTDETILATFNPSAGEPRATQLTTYDLALVRGVYASRGDQPEAMVKAKVVRDMRRLPAD